MNWPVSAVDLIVFIEFGLVTCRSKSSISERKQNIRIEQGDWCVLLRAI